LAKNSTRRDAAGAPDGKRMSSLEDIVTPARATRDVTHLLTVLEHGDPHAASRLLPLDCDELARPTTMNGLWSVAREVWPSRPGRDNLAARKTA
jgi:hypothetical protein